MKSRESRILCAYYQQSNYLNTFSLNILLSLFMTFSYLKQNGKFFYKCM